MNLTVRIHNENIFTGSKDYTDIPLPDVSIEEFHFKENEIVSIDTYKEIPDKDPEKIPLKSQYITREFHPHTTNPAKDEMFYHFVFCKYQQDKSFTYVDFAHVFEKLIKRRTDNKMLFTLNH